MTSKKTRKKTSTRTTEIPKVKSVEGFSSRSGPDLRGAYMGEAPSDINAFMTIFRWRVTAELIEEPKEILAQRLVTLWENSQPNYHYTMAYRGLAAEFGAVLDPERRGVNYKGRS